MQVILQMLYNFVAQSDSVKDMSLLIDYKSIAQVAAKIAHLEANLMLWLRLSDSCVKRLLNILLYFLLNISYLGSFYTLRKFQLH